MEEFLTRLWTDLIERGGGPLHFRFILQPTIAALIGIRDGLRYARESRSFLLWGGPTDPAERRAQHLASWRAIAKILVLAIILDAVYEIIVLQWFYPLETLIVAVEQGGFFHVALWGGPTDPAERRADDRCPDWDSLP